MRFNLNDIEAFLLVVETSSISAAALRLGLAKSVVSKRITDLENALGTRLLNRSTRGVAPTDRGQAFYERAREFMRQLEDAAEASVEDENRLCGRLRIATPMSFGTMYLSPLLFEFAAAHPDLELSVDFDDHKVDIEGAGYDLAVRIGQLNDVALIAKPLAISRRVVCCSPAYAARHGLPESIDDLQRHRCIGYTYVHSGQLWQFEGDGNARDVRSIVVRSTLMLNNGEAMRDAAIAGVGIGLLPLFIVAAALRDGRLLDALPKHRPTSDTIYAMYPQRKLQPRGVRVFVDYLKERLGGPPPWER